MSHAGIDTTSLWLHMSIYFMPYNVTKNVLGVLFYQASFASVVFRRGRM